jgi:hypothetical protein
MAENNSNFVIGFICQSKVSNDPAMIHMTPGIVFNFKYTFVSVILFK